MSSFDGSSAFVTYHRKFLMFHRDNRPDVASPNCWGLLGGGAEEGETPEQTMIRELQEEANITPTNFQFLFIRQPKNTYVYHVQLTETQANKVRLGDEGQELGYFTLEELRNLKLTPSMKEHLTIRKDLLIQLVKD